MTVLMAQDTFLPKLGGAEVHVWKLSKALSENGYQVTIATTTKGPPIVDGLSVYRFPLLQSQGKKAVAALPFNLPALIRLVIQHDLIHGHYTALCSAILGTLALIFRRPFVLTLHGYGTLDSSVQGNFWLQLWRRLAFRAADKVIATSSEMAEVARRFVADERVIIIPNGVDTQVFKPSDDALLSSPIRVATVRRLVPKNGVQYLVESAPIILQQSPKPVEFWIIGDGHLREYLEARVKELGVNAAFRFFGAIPNEQVKEVLEQVHIVVFPSSAESTSIAALEAMAMGKPVIASAVGGYPELLGANERGLLVKLFDRTTSDYEAPMYLPAECLKALSEAIVQLVREPELAETLSKRARAYVQQYFDWRIIAEQIEQVYAEVSKGG